MQINRGGAPSTGGCGAQCRGGWALFATPAPA